MSVNPNHATASGNRGVQEKLNNLRRRIRAIEQSPALSGDPNIAAGSIDGAHIMPDSIDASHVAAGAITADEIAAGSIQAVHIVADAIDATHINAGSINAGHIAANAITATHITAGAITANHIGAGVIEAGHLSAGSVTAGAIAAGTIAAGHISAGAITASHISALAITTEHLAAQSVTAEKIAANTITASQIAANAITANAIAAGVITSGHIATNTIEAGNLAAGAITTDKIAAGAVTAEKITTTTLSAITTNMGSITAGTITGGTVQTSASGARVVMNSGGLFGYGLDGVTKVFEINAGSGIASFTGVAYLDGASTVPGSTIEAGSIDGSTKVTAGTIGALQIAAGSIEANHITAGAVTASKLSVEWGANNRVPNSRGEFDPNASGATNWGAVQATLGTTTTDGVSKASAITVTSTVANDLCSLYRESTHGSRVRGLSPGQKITMSGYVKAAAAGPTTAYLEVRWDNGTFDNSPNFTINATEWKRISYTFTVPSGVATAGYSYIFAATAVGQVVLWTDLQIESGEIATGYTPMAGEVAPGSVGPTQITPNSITTDQIMAGGIHGDRIQANTITANQIEAGSITSAELYAGAIEANRIQAIHIASGSITADKINFRVGAGNMLTNSSWEDGLVSWATPVGMSAYGVTDGSGSGGPGPGAPAPGYPAGQGGSGGRGGKYFWAQGTANTEGSFSHSEWVPTGPSKTFTLSVWACTTAASGPRSFRMEIEPRNQGATVLPTVQGPTEVLAINAVWTRHTFTFTTPSDAAEVRVRFVLLAGASTDHCSFDDVQLEPGGVATQWRQYISPTVIDGNSITAANITGGTITGATIQTATTGNRIVMTVASGMRLYTSQSSKSVGAGPQNVTWTANGSGLDIGSIEGYLSGSNENTVAVEAVRRSGQAGSVATLRAADQGGTTYVSGQEASRIRMFSPVNGSGGQIVADVGSRQITLLNSAGLTSLGHLSLGWVASELYVGQSSASRWVRTFQDTGWYSETFGGGWFMSDTSWVRAYNGKNVFADGTLFARVDLRAGSGGAGRIYAGPSNSPYIERYNGVAWDMKCGREDNGGWAYIYAAGYPGTSDVRLKENPKTKAEVLPGGKAAPVLGKLTAIRHRWKDHPEDMAEAWTLAADSVEEVLPEAVVTIPKDEDSGMENVKFVHYNYFIPLLIEAVKELSAEVEELRGKVKP